MLKELQYEIQNTECNLKTRSNKHTQIHTKDAKHDLAESKAMKTREKNKGLEVTK